ncbi:formamidopyrimidine-DNA glycosylase [Candidatus Binatia bacterium]|jgi:formamidopyrimidine-DNA glycosylase|nr:formamidopyrimidine-DNA glycosylase [Candidatus Binatia bacterium]
MPELPDVELYVALLRERIVGQPLESVRLKSPFVLRTFDPPLAAATGKTVRDVRRLGKRVVLVLDDELFLVVHLMIAGRFRWEKRGAKPAGKIGLAAFDFPNGTLLLTEASPKKRASLHLVRGAEALAAHHAGGIEPLECDLEAFSAALTRESHTLKRVLTDPRVFSGIGNAYSDEILHAARLSPVKHTGKLTPDENARLYQATHDVLTAWTERLRAEFAERFPGPGDVTAFRPDFAVHGRFGEPCRVCGKPVQRIRYADNETNYCAVCQNEGRRLADRALSRILHDSYARTLDDED